MQAMGGKRFLLDMAHVFLKVTSPLARPHVAPWHLSMIKMTLDDLNPFFFQLAFKDDKQNKGYYMDVASLKKTTCFESLAFCICFKQSAFLKQKCFKQSEKKTAFHLSSWYQNQIKTKKQTKQSDLGWAEKTCHSETKLVRTFGDLLGGL